MIRLFEASQHTKQYAQSRPIVNQQLVDLTMQYFNEKSGPSRDSILVDVGCGTGQATEPFTSYFKKVYGLDPSPNMIENASNSLANTEYRVGTAEELPFETESVDLISTCEAAHWFDITRFLNECHRILKPNGCLAIHGYQVGKIRTEADESSNVANTLLKNFMSSCRFHEKIQILSDSYIEIHKSVQSGNKERHEWTVEHKINLQDFKNYLETWSGYQTALADLRKENRDSEGNVSMEAIKKLDPIEIFCIGIKRSLRQEDEADSNIEMIWEQKWFSTLSTRPYAI